MIGLCTIQMDMLLCGANHQKWDIKGTACVYVCVVCVYVSVCGCMYHSSFPQSSWSAADQITATLTTVVRCRASSRYSVRMTRQNRDNSSSLSLEALDCPWAVSQSHHTLCVDIQLPACPVLICACEFICLLILALIQVCVHASCII